MSVGGLILAAAEKQAESNGDGLFGLGFLQEIIGGAVLLIVAALIERFVRPVIGKRGEARRRRPSQKRLLSFLVHLRMATEADSTGHFDDPTTLHAEIRRYILEPIPRFLQSNEDELVKVVWFKPDAAQRLIAVEQVGYSDREQSLIRLEPGMGVAGQAFKEGQPVEIPDTEKERGYVAIPDFQNEDGALICVPVLSGVEVTGVLSVLSTRQNAFRTGDDNYLETLAAMIAALERRAVGDGQLADHSGQ